MHPAVSAIRALSSILLLCGLSPLMAIEEMPLPRTPLPPWPELALVTWRFDLPGWQTNSQPLTCNATLVPGWSGYALRRSGTGPSLCVLPEISVNGQTNLPAQAPASVRFWFAPDWTSASAGGNGPGEAAYLFLTGRWSTQNAVRQVALWIEPDGNAVRLEVNQSYGVQTVLRTAIQWNAGQWHQVALTVSIEQGTVLWVDGTPGGQRHSGDAAVAVSGGLCERVWLGQRRGGQAPGAG